MSTTVYKLTDKNDKTRAGESNECQWGEGITHTADGNGDLCTDHWIHAYPDPLLAVMMDRVHANYLPKGHLWECKADVGLEKSDKIGCKSLTTIKLMDVPKVTTDQRRAFAIMCALEVYNLWEKYDKDGKWKKWAEGWLSGKGRSTAAYAAAAAAAADADAAGAAAAYAAAADAAADAAAYAASAAVRAGQAKKIDLVAIAHKAVKVNEGEVQVELRC